MRASPLGGFGVSNLILPEFDALFLVNCFIFKVIFSGGLSLSRAFRYGKVELSFGTFQQISFAPHTTGIPFGIDKELEIIKQMFDCWTLLQEMDDYQTVEAVYDHVAQVEAGYRGLSIQSKDVLLDTIQSCLCIMGRNGIRPDDYRHYLTGINAIQGHIFRGRINGENAGMLACEIMYLAACLLTKADSFERVSDPEAYKDFAFTLKEPPHSVQREKEVIK